MSVIYRHWARLTKKKFDNSILAADCNTTNANLEYRGQYPRPVGFLRHSVDARFSCICDHKKPSDDNSSSYNHYSHIYYG